MKGAQIACAEGLLDSVNRRPDRHFMDPLMDLVRGLLYTHTHPPATCTKDLCACGLAHDEGAMDLLLSEKLTITYKGHHSPTTR